MQGQATGNREQKLGPFSPFPKSSATSAPALLSSLSPLTCNLSPLTCSLLLRKGHIRGKLAREVRVPVQRLNLLALHENLHFLHCRNVSRNRVHDGVNGQGFAFDTRQKTGQG